MRGKRTPATEAPRILGAKPLGVTKRVADEIVRNVRRKLNQNGRLVTLKAMRFLPSSRAAAGNGSFQFVASTIVEVAAGEDSSPRPEALDSVVTVGWEGRAQKLQHISIPALERASS